MRTLTLTFAIAFTFICTAWTQVPSGIKYQGVARNGFGEVFSNKNIHFRISVLSNSANRPPVYVETQMAQTNEYGLFSLVIGDGQAASGSFNSIEWVSGSKWMKIEMDPNGGGNFYTVGTSELLAVPY